MEKDLKKEKNYSKENKYINNNEYENYSNLNSYREIYNENNINNNRNNNFFSPKGKQIPNKKFFNFLDSKYKNLKYTNDNDLYKINLTNSNINLNTSYNEASSCKEFGNKGKR